MMQAQTNTRSNYSPQTFLHKWNISIPSHKYINWSLPYKTSAAPTCLSMVLLTCDSRSSVRRLVAGSDNVGERLFIWLLKNIINSVKLLSGNR